MTSTSTKEKLHKLEVDRVLKEGVHDDLIHKRIKIAEGVACPLCIKRQNGTQGDLVKRNGAYGPFLSCSTFPLCKFSWNTRDDE